MEEISHTKVSLNVSHVGCDCIRNMMILILSKSAAWSCCLKQAIYQPLCIFVCVCDPGQKTGNYHCAHLHRDKNKLHEWKWVLHTMTKETLSIDTFNTHILISIHIILISIFMFLYTYICKYSKSNEHSVCKKTMIQIISKLYNKRILNHEWLTPLGGHNSNILL